MYTRVVMHAGDFATFVFEEAYEFFICMRIPGLLLNCPAFNSPLSRYCQADVDCSRRLKLFLLDYYWLINARPAALLVRLISHTELIKIHDYVVKFFESDQLPLTSEVPLILLVKVLNLRLFHEDELLPTNP